MSQPHLPSSCLAVMQRTKSHVLLQTTTRSSPTLSSPLVHTLEWWDSLALVLVECRADNTTVGQVDLAVGLLLPAERVLHPVVVVTIREILTGVGTTGFLSGSGRGSGLGTIE